jgi:hypothetical protein
MARPVASLMLTYAHAAAQQDFTPREPDWGYMNFVELDKILDDAEGLLRDGHLRISVRINAHTDA